MLSALSEQDSLLIQLGISFKIRQSCLSRYGGGHARNCSPWKYFFSTSCISSSLKGLLGNAIKFTHEGEIFVHVQRLHSPYLKNSKRIQELVLLLKNWSISLIALHRLIHQLPGNMEGRVLGWPSPKISRKWWKVLWAYQARQVSSILTGSSLQPGVTTFIMPNGINKKSSKHLWNIIQDGRWSA